MKYVIIFFILLSYHANAQTPARYNHVTNDVQLIHSQILNQDRYVYIHVPKIDSNQVNKPLDVLYLLDGENHFHIVSAYVEYLRHWGVIPPVIVVGILSADRVKDLTPTNSLIDFDGNVDSRYKTSGGNEQFLNFVKQELMTYVEGRYKTSRFKIFAGHSFGGLTVINCMLNHPEMFDAYVAVSPSLWFDNKYVLRLAEQKLAAAAITGKKLFYSVGNEDGTFRNDVLEFNKLFRHRSLRDFEHMYKDYPFESHMTEPIPAYYDALRFVYKTWAPETTK
ncbi:alpha/beta hydrolase [Pseudochryseolinea flava]|uniref:Alpha/beta hydrolase n=1 Tax=Pseudochryseolinea flava TaxID=2059302 RepID=A0A364Y848_9BACT|nr:alpha/beta hydrolase-fold protein [Pseudochryseolinea flava]RAW02040.1 hypothetical protein DQQ10_05660 [Pseudochryseolinea flava]